MFFTSYLQARKILVILGFRISGSWFSAFRIKSQPGECKCGRRVLIHVLCGSIVFCLHVGLLWPTCTVRHYSEGSQISFTIMSAAKMNTSFILNEYITPQVNQIRAKVNKKFTLLTITRTRRSDNHILCDSFNIQNEKNYAMFSICENIILSLI